jgi:hypothetical protein
VSKAITKARGTPVVASKRATRAARLSDEQRNALGIAISRWRHALDRPDAAPMLLRRLDARRLVTVDIPGQGPVERRLGPQLSGGTLTLAERDDYLTAAAAFDRAARTVNDLDLLIRAEIAHCDDLADHDPPVGDQSSGGKFDDLRKRLADQIDAALDSPIGERSYARRCREDITLLAWQTLPERERADFVVGIDATGKPVKGAAFVEQQSTAAAYVDFRVPRGSKGLTLASEQVSTPRSPDDWARANALGVAALALKLARVAALFRDLALVVARDGRRRKDDTRQLLTDARAIGLTQRQLAEALAADEHIELHGLGLSARRLSELQQGHDLAQTAELRAYRRAVFLAHFGNVRLSR